ncbi:hypothetical protein, partial [Streptococcus suis]|uniref:hypothetical protein n=1 Tax=Streptococcus suis TaxID=1307 RepID=UPI002FCB3B76
NVSLVAFHYRSYGTFCIYLKRLHNLHGGFTHYRNYRAAFLFIKNNKIMLRKNYGTIESLTIKEK